jgi:hypothetical protein
MSMSRAAGTPELDAVVGDREAFWTTPCRDTEQGISDPLGLDAMELQIADRLVPCLTSRTAQARFVFWTLVLIRWAAHARSDPERSHAFLCHERVLKLCWARSPERPGTPTSFSGSNRAKLQHAWEGEPQVDRLVRLLQQQRAQGLLGIHLGPLRAVGLVEKDQLTLTALGKKSLNGIPERLEFTAGSWTSLERALDQVDAERRLPAFSRAYADLLQTKMRALATSMQQLGRSLRPDQPRWDAVADGVADLAPIARLADAFPAWATTVRQWFITAIRNGIPGDALPPFLSLSAARDLDAFASLRAIGRKGWKRRGPAALTMLARLHHATVAERELDSDLCWIDVDGSHPLANRASEPPTRVNDCRWSNAVNLMFPRLVAGWLGDPADGSAESRSADHADELGKDADILALHAIDSDRLECRGRVVRMQGDAGVLPAVAVSHLGAAIPLDGVRAAVLGVADRAMLDQQDAALAAAGDRMAEQTPGAVGDGRLHRMAADLGDEQVASFGRPLQRHPTHDLGLLGSTEA